MSTLRQPMAGALVHHAGNNYADALTSGLCAVGFQHSANSRRQILNKLRNIENGIVSFKGKLSTREITKHHVGLAEANVNRDCQTIVSSDVQEGRLPAPGGFTGGAFVDHTLRY
jgi:hypothetical protein